MDPLIVLLSIAILLVVGGGISVYKGRKRDKAEYEAYLINYATDRISSTPVEFHSEE